MAAVDAALGFGPGQSEADGWAALAVLDDPGPRGAQRRRALAEAVALTDYQFNAHGLELGYIYRGNAVVDPDPASAPQPASDAHLHYRPTTRPGARVPHARLERDGVPISTLDLVDGLGFTLLTGPGGQHWTQAAAEVSSRLGVPISVHLVGRRTGGLADPYLEWAELREVDSDGCVLVRPDRHVAWRSTRFDASAARELGAVLEQILARSGAESSTAERRAPELTMPRQGAQL